MSGMFACFKSQETGWININFLNVMTLLIVSKHCKMHLSNLYKALLHIPWIHRNSLVWYLAFLFPADWSHLFRELLKTTRKFPSRLLREFKSFRVRSYFLLCSSSAVWCRHLLLISKCLWNTISLCFMYVGTTAFCREIAYTRIIILELVSCICKCVL